MTVASTRSQTYTNINIFISDASSVETLKGMEVRKEATVLFDHAGSVTKFDNLEDLIAVKWTPDLRQLFKWDTVTRNWINHDRDQKEKRSPAGVQSRGWA